METPIATVSVPNLNLCSAVLLVQLVLHLKKLALYERLSAFHQSDNQIILAWLNKHPSHPQKGS
jgi:phosphoribosylcarboxyaminoimidazole (NCAIR) mutase